MLRNPSPKLRFHITNTQIISKHCSATFSFSNGPKPPMTPLQKKSTPFLPWLWPSALDLQVEPFARKAADWKRSKQHGVPSISETLRPPKVLWPGQKDREKNERLLRGMPASWENSAFIENVQELGSISWEILGFNNSDTHPHIYVNKTHMNLIQKYDKICTAGKQHRSSQAAWKNKLHFP